MNGRVLAVDPGEKRIGLAISDPTGTIASPLGVLKHVARTADAAAIVRFAEQHGAVQIVVGQPLNDDGSLNPQARSSQRLADEIRMQTTLPVVMWDESGSTQAAQAARRAMGVSRRKRSGHLDEIAATFILQSYLDAGKQPPAETGV
jgi:putative holliday junction resolvase